MTDYHWAPITPLSDPDRAIDLASIQPLYDSWRAQKRRLQQLGDVNVKSFTDRLVRRLSIETGILERLYDLDRGTTEALVAQGFVAELVSRSSTDLEPTRLIDILRDQEAAIQLLMDCVSGNRLLTKGVLHELHSILTAHQDSTTAMDQFGRRFDIPLLKGRYKEQPNNPKRPDGSVHEYCPPIQVDSEMENLLSWLSACASEDPIIVAAWLHHRFTQIHPYQDGNGRVARSLITYVLLRADLLPLVIDRDLRMDYIYALEVADSGNLSDLASIFARLERAAILQALSVDVDAEVAHERTLAGAVINTLAKKFGRRREAKEADLRKVNDVAVRLRTTARRHVEQTFSSLAEPLLDVGKPEIYVAEGGPERENSHWFKFEVVKSNSHWFKFEVVKSANESGKFANFSEAHYFLKGTVRVARERLVFVVSFHHVGRELSGVMEATAFSKLESFEQSEDRESVAQDFVICSVEPFVITHETKEKDVAAAFSRWLDAALAVAIKEYGDRL